MSHSSPRASAAFAVFAALTAFAMPLRAQDVVTLHSVTIDANDDVTVVYSKNFATCAHLHASNATCTQNGAILHVQNWFCTQGSMVAVTVPITAFNAGFGPGQSVYLVHGNNANVQSACVAVGCDGAYGSGCAGATGTPVLGAVDVCPPQGTTLDLGVTNGPPGSLAVLGFGLSRLNLPVLGCTLLIGGIQGTAVVVFDNAGAGGFSLPLPPGSAGFDFTVQAFALDAGGPQGFSATNGLLIRVQ